MQEANAHSRYKVPVNPSYYDLLRDGEETCYPYPTTENLPKSLTTFKDLPGNVANRLKDAKVGDRLVFICAKERMKELSEEQRAEYERELEKEITYIEFDPLQHVRKIFFNP